MHAVDNGTAYFSGTVSYTRRIFMGWIPWGMYYKRLWIRNLQEIETFRSKLVSSGLDIHASLKNILV
jgi:hypothetical protein